MKLFPLLTNIVLLSLLCLANADIYTGGQAIPFEARFRNRRFEYVMHQPTEDVCTEQKVKTLAFIMSGTKNVDKREAIRASWMNEKSNPEGYLNLFLVGQTQDSELNDQLDAEQAKYGDMVRYSYEDLYDLLPLKTHVALTWFNKFCPNASYLMKVDDDTVVYQKRLNHFVLTEFDRVVDGQPSTIFCKVLVGKKPFRSPQHKYHVSKREYPGDKYPAYCKGASYLLSRNAVSAILDSTRDVRFMRMEDVLFTGIIAQHAKIHRYDAEAFGSGIKEFANETSVPRLSTVIGLAAEKIRPAFRLLKNASTMGLLRYDYHFRTSNI